MGIKCCVSGCPNIYKKKQSKLEADENCSFLSFHRFPTNLQVQTAWIFNVRQINGCNWQPTNLSFVCSEHFDYFSWEKNREDGKRKLKFQAVPSIFNNLSQKSQNDHNYSRMLMKDISNSWAFSYTEKNKLHSSTHDHTYARKPVSSDEKLSMSTSTPIKKTSLTTSTEITDKNISNTSEIESGFFSNVNSNIILNCSDIFTNSCTTVQNNTSYILPELMIKVTDYTTAQTIKEQTIDITSLKKENEQLKKELTKLKKSIGKILQQNETLHKNNKKLHQENKILTNLQKKTKENMSKILNKDQIKAIYRKNYQGLPWEPKTLKKALILKLKYGSSGYRELGKQIPLPSIRTLQRKIKHIEFRSEILQETVDLLKER